MNGLPPRNRKGEILDAALALAFEGGPNRVTTVAIAERLGLTQPAIYRHFSSKAALWEAITERLGAAVAGNIARADAAAGAPLGRLRMLMLGHLAIVTRTPALPEIMLARDPGSADALVRVAMQAQMAGFQKAVLGYCRAAQDQGALRGDIDAGDMATLLMGVLQSLVLKMLMSRDAEGLVADGERLLDIQLAAFSRDSEG